MSLLTPKCSTIQDKIRLYGLFLLNAQMSIRCLLSMTIIADYATQEEWEGPQVIKALFQKHLICSNAKMTLQDLVVSFPGG